MKNFLKNTFLVLALLVSGWMLQPATASINIPYVFVPFTTIQSAQMNANFSALSTNALNVNGDTMLGDLKFTDALYDIGKLGATRPRDFFNSRDLTVGRNAAVTGTLAVTSTSAFTGAVTLTGGLNTPLVVSQGGTGIASGVSGGVGCYTGTTTFASSGLLNLRGILLGGGAGACPTSLGAMSAGQQIYGVTGGNPVFGNFAYSHSNPSNKTGTTSTSFVMDGLACSFTPTVTGRGMLSISFDMSQTTLNSVAFAKLAYSTGAAPNNGDAATGTVISAQHTLIAPASGSYPFGYGFNIPVTGLTLNTAIWFDLQFSISVSGTNTITAVDCTAQEF